MELPNSLEGNYEYIFENIRDIIFTLSLDGRIISVTREFENSTGWSRDEWLGKHFQDLVHPDDIEGVIQGFKDVISGDVPAPYEARVKSKSGDILTFEAKSAPFIINNKISGYLGIARDITKRKEMEEALRTSKHQYRDIIDSLGDPIHVVNKDRKIILNNPAFSSWLKELNIHSDISGKTVNEAFPFLDKKVIKEYDRVFNSNSPLLTVDTSEINGEIFVTETRKIPICRYGEVEQVLTVIRNITDSKKMEKQLKESEERLRSFMDSATDYFSLWDSNLNIIEVNKPTLDFFSKSFNREMKKEEIIGRNMMEFAIKPEDTIQMQEVLRSGIPYSSDELVPHQMFGYRIFAVRAFKVGDGLGLISSDITDKKKMEEEIKASEELFRSIFENAPIGLALADLKLQFTKINAALCQMLGYSEIELNQMSFSEITHPEHRENDIKYINKLKTGLISSYKAEKRFIKNNQEIIWARTTVFIQRNDKGTPSYFLIICEDISVMKEKEEEIRRQLLKYNTEEGQIYLIKEKIPTLSYTVFKDLIKFGYNGLIVTRTRKKDFNNDLDNKRIKFLQLSGKNTVNDFLKILREKKDKRVILIDRLEYLFITQGFESIAQFLYTLSDIVFLQNLIVLISIDSSVLTDRELAILERETKEIEPRHLPKVSEELINILHVINQKNSLGLKPSYSDVGSTLKISRPTIRKRIKSLVSIGYLIENNVGKSKKLELSPKGKSLISS